MKTKQCTMCKKFYPATLDYFYKNCESLDGLGGYCKQCQHKANVNAYAKAKASNMSAQKEHYKTLPPTKTCICKKCNKPFEVAKSEKGYFYLKRKFCDDCSRPSETKIVQCLTCGKEIVLKRSKTTGEFLQQRYCDECLKPMEFKISICQSCGKSFKVKRSKNGNCYTRKFCDDCLVDNKETKTIICQICNKPFTVGRKTGQYGFIQRKLCDNCFYTSITSIPEKKFENLLNENNIRYTREYCINGLYYDFYLPDYNVLIEINPTFSHTSMYNGFYTPKSKEYHYNKSKNAYDSNFVCICIWDWMDYDEVIELIKKNKLEMKYVGIKLVYSRGKETSDSEISISEGFYPIYTDGYDIIKISNNQ